MHLLHNIIPELIGLLSCLPFLALSFGSGGNEAVSTTHTETNTTSGDNSPSASGGSGIIGVGSGSISVAGDAAKYQETGAYDYSGANLGGIGGDLTTGSGSTITIGDPSAVSALGQIADRLATAVTTPASSGGGGGGVGGTLNTLTQNVNWTLIAIAAAVVLGLYLLFGKKK